MRDVKQFSSDKILSHIDRIQEWIDTGYSRPITYEIDMTNVCNNNCPFCFGFYKRLENRHSLTKVKAEEILKQIKDFGGRAVTFTGGGEPLCNPDTLETMRFSKSLGIDTGFISNGLLLDDKAASAITESCIWTRISMDAGSAKIYEKTHGINGDAFEKILENINKLVELKKKTGSNIVIGLGYLTPPVQKDDMRDFVLLGKKLGVDYVQFRPMLKRFGEKKIDFDNEETINFINELAMDYGDDKTEVLYSKHKYDELRNMNIVRPYTKCFGHHFATVIGSDAKMYLCCHTRGIEKYCIGDLNKQTLQDIWKSPARKEVFRKIDFSDCPYLCRCDSFNTILWHIKKEKQHKNFL